MEEYKAGIVWILVLCGVDVVFYGGVHVAGIVDAIVSIYQHW
jgi:hypothetical protein